MQGDNTPPIDLAKTIYAEGIVHDAEGNSYPLESEIPETSAKKIFKLVNGNQSIRKTLEVGCAYGLSTLHICGGLYGRPDVHHTIIDPFQYLNWHGIGVENVRRSGFTEFNLIENLSELALPELLRHEKCYDMILVDGVHTFDHTLLDMFYANRMLKLGGFLIVDDCDWRSISRAISYFLNYPCYELYTPYRERGSSLMPEIMRGLARKFHALSKMLRLDPFLKSTLHPAIYRKIFSIRFPRLVILQKIGKDERFFLWHNEFF
uniref:Methyltransferase domain-containing protein n=1 Tax=Candidatus Kentrum sp. DK TaxID=2126562 RepID=A0A450T5S2_9GAMM|nr:MAG: Methyltransferase domain-containing protein [Candidatus Kentron sp. DK]